VTPGSSRTLHFCTVVWENVGCLTVLGGPAVPKEHVLDMPGRHPARTKVVIPCGVSRYRALGETPRSVHIFKSLSGAVLLSPDGAPMAPGDVFVASGSVSSGSETFCFCFPGTSQRHPARFLGFRVRLWRYDTAIFCLRGRPGASGKRFDMHIYVCVYMLYIYIDTYMMQDLILRPPPPKTPPSISTLQPLLPPTLLTPM